MEDLGIRGVAVNGEYLSITMKLERLSHYSITKIKLIPITILYIIYINLTYDLCCDSNLLNLTKVADVHTLLSNSMTVSPPFYLQHLFESILDSSVMGHQKYALLYYFYY